MIKTAEFTIVYIRGCLSGRWIGLESFLLLSIGAAPSAFGVGVGIIGKFSLLAVMTQVSRLNCSLH